MADYDADIDPRVVATDDQTCVSSITGFDFELYPESGRMYPALETVPSETLSVSIQTTVMPRVSDERIPALPVLHEVKPSAKPYFPEVNDLEAPMAQMTNQRKAAPPVSPPINPLIRLEARLGKSLGDLEAPLAQKLNGQREASVPACATTIPVSELDNKPTKSSDRLISELMQGAQRSVSRSTPVNDSKATFTSVGFNQPVLEDATKGIQPMPSPTPSPEFLPGAYPVQGINARNGIDELEVDVGVGEVKEEEEEEEEFQVHEAHLVAAEDDPESASVKPARVSKATEEVLEGKAIKLRDQHEENRQGKPIVWWLMAACFSGALFVLLLVFVVGPSDENHRTDNHQNAAEDGAEDLDTVAPMIWYPPFLEDIPAEIIHDIEEKVHSPYYKANLWVWNDPNMDSYSPERLKQRFYLAMMYYATNGDGWLRKDNWLSYEVSECGWFSHSAFLPDSKYYEPHVCDHLNGTSTVINLSLAANNLTGYFPIYYDAFIPELRILDLGHNHIGGVFPVMTGAPDLEVFVMSNNDFQGPYSFAAGAHWDNIKVILSDGAKTRGNNGGAVFHILDKGLEVYNITGMTNDGQLWTEIGMMTNLEYWGHGHSDTSGTIPSEIGLLTSLKQIDLSSLPYLSGTIPSELGLLTELTLFDLAETPLTGTVPTQLCERVHAGLLEIPANCSSLKCC